MITEFITNVQQLIQSNQIIAGAFSLWGLSVITFLARNLPSKVINFIKTQFTTILVLNNQDTIYYETLRWITKVGIHRFTRIFNVNNERWGYQKNMFSLGYGTHWMFWNKRIVWFTRQIDASNQTSYVKETIKITILGRSQSNIKNLLDCIDLYNKNLKQDDNIKIYNFIEGNWMMLTTIPKRPLDSIIIDKDNKKLVVDQITNFKNSKQWYLENGIPYHLGILFKGCPGTGKSSFIKGLCSHFNFDLYILNLKTITDCTLMNAFSKIPESTIVVIEDIDRYKVTKKEEIVDEETKEFLSMSGLLNALDGIASAENRILIATTNHPEKLDDGLLRPGRIDLQVEIGHMSRENLEIYLNRFYKDFKLDDNTILKSNIVPCEVQQLVMMYKDDVNKVIEKLRE